MADWRRAQRYVDPVVAVALLGAGLYALWLLPPEESDFVAPPAVDAAFLLLTCVPLAWRSRQPVRVFAVVLAGVWLWLLLFYGDQPQPPYPPGVALVLATYSAAAVPRPRVAWAVGVALAAFLVSTDVPAVLSGRQWGDVLPSWVLFTLAFTVGRIVGLRQEQLVAAAERASASEAGREEQAPRAGGPGRGPAPPAVHPRLTPPAGRSVASGPTGGPCLSRKRAA